MANAERDFQRTFERLAKKALCEVVRRHPDMTIGQFAGLMGDEPLLGKVLVGELFAAPSADDAANAIADALRVSDKSYDEVHTLVDRLWLPSVLDEAGSISAAAEQLEISRDRLRRLLSRIEQ